MNVSHHVLQTDILHKRHLKQAPPGDLLAYLHKVGARELKQHTGEILERVRKGERIVLTHRGEAIALVSPLDRDSLEWALARKPSAPKRSR